MADDHDNDVDAGWDDIEAGWEVEASEPEPDQSDEPKAKPSANERITAESDPLPSMIPIPPLAPDPDPAPPTEEPGFTADDVTANRLYDETLLTEAANKAKDEAVVTIEPSELMEGRSARQSKDTVKRIKAITAGTERRLMAEAAAPAEEPSGQAFEVPSPLKTSGSGPAAVQSQLQVEKPSGVNLSLVVFFLLLVLALGAVGAVILAAFF
jgi:hypothetical protein